MQVNYDELVSHLAESELLSRFKISSAKLSQWLPICRYNSKNLPKRTFLEPYTKLLKTRGITHVKNSVRLRSESRVLMSNWRFPFQPTEYAIRGGWLYVKVPHQFISLILESSVKKKHSIILPKQLELAPEDFVAIGLLKGEMISSVRGKSRHYCSFTNSEPLLLAQVLRFLKKLGVEQNQLSFQIIINVSDGTKLSKDEYVSHWSRCLNLPKAHFVKPHMDMRYSTSHKWGAASIKNYSTPFRLFMQFFVDYIIDHLNEEGATSFMKGLMAAEGSIHFSPNSSLNFVSIGGSKPKDTRQYKRALRKIGIIPGAVVKGTSNSQARLNGWKKGNGGYMIIQGWDNFKKIYTKKLLEFSLNKRLKFLYSLTHHRMARKDEVFGQVIHEFETLRRKNPGIYCRLLAQRKNPTRTERNVLLFMQGKGPLGRSSLSAELGITPASVSRRLSSMRDKGLVKHNRKNGMVSWSAI